MEERLVLYQLRRDFEDNATAGRSAVRGCAEEIALGVDRQSAGRGIPVGAREAAGAKIVNRRKDPAAG